MTAGEMREGLLANRPEYTVGELSAALKRTVEDAFGHVRVRGEISGFKRAASGHLYLALKDDSAVLDAVCWKGVAAGLRFKPEDGLEVICTGRITTYPGRSKYQIVIEAMEPAGIGALMALLEERKRKLAAEGLFDADRKKPLPYLPEVIGVVTSPTGAVIRDILHRLADRFPRHVLIWPVLVQGEGAAEQIAAGIRGFNAIAEGGDVPRPDVLIVARGGGSLEDLWAFNEEVVVRAAAESVIPLISAVGHETDTTLIDYASDLRAPTPTAAAELAVPVRADLIDEVDSLALRQRRAVNRFITDRRDRLTGLVRGLPRLKDLLSLPQQMFDDLSERLPRALRANTALHRERLRIAAAGLRPLLVQERLRRHEAALGDLTRRLVVTLPKILEQGSTRLSGLARLLESLGYRQVLNRGYAVVRDPAGLAVTSAGTVRAGDALDIEFRDGRVPAVAGQGPRLIKPKRKSVKDGPAKDEGGGDQGSLF
jgi:exodeoxyribonuclease VII large subunit